MNISFDVHDDATADNHSEEGLAGSREAFKLVSQSSTSRRKKR